MQGAISHMWEILIDMIDIAGHCFLVHLSMLCALGLWLRRVRLFPDYHHPVLANPAFRGAFPLNSLLASPAHGGV